MGQHVYGDQSELPTGRTEASVAAEFPDRGEQPSDEVVVDENADEAPNTDHPA